MVSKQVRAKKVDSVRNLWLAGLGAVSLAQKQGGKVYGELVAEGKTVRNRTDRLAEQVGHDVKSRVRAGLTRVQHAVERNTAGILSRFGIPSKKDVDALTARIEGLSRQLRTKR